MTIPSLLALILSVVACGQSDSGSTLNTTRPFNPQVTPTTVTEEVLPFGWTKLTYQGRSYYCDTDSLSDHGDCEVDRGSRPFSINSPTLFCSDISSFSPECDEQWYPDVLASAKFVTHLGVSYVCRAPLGEFNNFECFQYRGGDPSRYSPMFPDLYCSGSTMMECNEDYFPSDLEDVEIVTIDGGRYVCEGGYGGNECFKWSGVGSPKDATRGYPDYFCNYNGECAEDDYP